MAISVSFFELLEPLETKVLPPLTDGDVLDKATETESIASVQAQIEELYALASQETEMLLDDAKVQAEALREAAWQEGFHEGQTTGRTAMELTLRDEWETEKRALRTQIEEIISEIGVARQILWERQEAEMVEFVLTIARQVIKTEVAQNQEIIRNLLHNALRRVTDKSHLRVRVSVEDASRVRAMRDELLQMTDGIHQLEIIDDRRVGEGGCVIETAAGTIDAKIETQMAEIERALGIQGLALDD